MDYESHRIKEVFINGRKGSFLDLRQGDYVHRENGNLIATRISESGSKRSVKRNRKPWIICSLFCIWLIFLFSIAPIDLSLFLAILSAGVTAFFWLLSELN